MELETKKMMYDLCHENLTKAIQQLSDYLLTYEDSRYQKVALEKVEEAYLWATQMIHSKIQKEEDALTVMKERQKLNEEIQEADVSEAKEAVV